MQPTSNETQVVVVDDDSAQLQTVTMALEMNGYRVTPANSSREALSRLKDVGRTAAPRIMITDIEMPEMNGCDLINVGRQVCEDLGVIVITGYGTRDLMLKLLRQGIDDYLDKPFDVDKLLAAVHAVEGKLRLRDRLVADRKAILDRHLAGFEADLDRRLATLSQYEALAKLASGVVHDCNNWLGVILGEASLLGDALAPLAKAGLIQGAEAEGPKVIVEACAKARQTLRDLQVFSKTGIRAFSVVNVEDLVHGVARLIRSTLPATIRLEVRAETGRTAIFGDGIMLQNALLNLLINARDAMPEGGTIFLSAAVATAESLAPDGCTKGSACVRISVRDTGCGMAPEVWQRMFEPFFTTKGDKGNGLGLPGVLNTVSEHQGCIDFDTAPGTGTEFRLWFPIGLG